MAGGGIRQREETAKDERRKRIALRIENKRESPESRKRKRREKLTSLYSLLVKTLLQNISISSGQTHSAPASQPSLHLIPSYCLLNFSLSRSPLPAPDQSTVATPCGKGKQLTDEREGERLCCAAAYRLSTYIDGR